ncbi:MAG: hypothetical protein ACFB4I_19030 [Cyanophyceae cyanobacterium]
MNFMSKSRRFLSAIALTLVLTIATACASAPTAQRIEQLPPGSNGQVYSQIERGSTPQGQQFGDWVVQTSQGLIQDAYVRDNNKLGVVISPQVEPNEVRPLARSLAQGFHRNFPSQDLTVLMYAPDKKLILTAQYDQQSNQIQYQ